MRYMYIIILVAILLSLATIPALGNSLFREKGDWETFDTVLLGTVLATEVYDYFQTLDIKNHPELCEGNPILGENPTDDEIRDYFLSLAGSNILIALLFKPNIRRTWLSGQLGAEVFCLVNNHQLGIRVKVKF